METGSWLPYIYSRETLFGRQEVDCLYLFKGRPFCRQEVGYLIFAQKETLFGRQVVGCLVFVQREKLILQTRSWLLILVQGETPFCRQEVVQRETLIGRQEVGCLYLFKGGH